MPIFVSPSTLVGKLPSAFRESSAARMSDVMDVFSSRTPLRRNTSADKASTEPAALRRGLTASVGLEVAPVPFGVPGGSASDPTAARALNEAPSGTASALPAADGSTTGALPSASDKHGTCG